MTEKEHAKNNVPRGPVYGEEPRLLNQDALDNLMRTLFAVTAELHVVRERLSTLETALVRAGSLRENAVEDIEEDEILRKQREADAHAYASRILSQLHRSRQPQSNVTPVEA